MLQDESTDSGPVASFSFLFKPCSGADLSLRFVDPFLVVCKAATSSSASLCSVVFSEGKASDEEPSTTGYTLFEEETKLKRFLELDLGRSACTVDSSAIFRPYPTYY